MTKLKNRYTSTSKKFVLILICALFALYPILAVSAQSGTIVNAAASSTQPHVGDTITVTVSISNVQNLYGIDMQLSWSPSVLQLVSNSNTSYLGVQSNPTGVLYAPSGDAIYYVEEDASQAIGQYNIVATSVAPATGWSGSGTIASIEFTVISTGSADLALTTQLSNYDPSGATFITHTDTASSVTAIAAGASTTPTNTPTSTPTGSSSTPISTTPTTTPTSTPEFPIAATLVIVIVLSSVAIVVSAKKIIKPIPVSETKS